MATASRSALIGWLYADLLVVLFIAALGGSTSQSRPEPTQTPTPEPTVTVTVTATPAAKPEEPSLMREPLKFAISVDSRDLRAGEGKTKAAFRKHFSQEIRKAAKARNLKPDNLRIGLSLTFGYNPNLALAQATSETANKLAAKQEPTMWQDSVPPKSYGNTDPRENPDQVSFEIYISNRSD